MNKPEKEMYFRAVSLSRWRNYTCCSPENCLFHLRGITDQPRQKGRWESRVARGAVLNCSLDFYRCVNDLLLLY